MKRSRLVVVVAMLVATAVLGALGVWQVRRLAWKQGLIATIEARIADPAAGLPEIEARWDGSGDVDYMPVVLAGTFRHELEQYYYATRNGAVGWHVFTPLALADGRLVFVNRGFVPDDRRDPATRSDGQLPGMMELTGLARNPEAERPNRFVPDNQLGPRTFFWRSLPQMTAAAGLGRAQVLPFFVDAGRTDIPGGLPAGGTTIVDIPNNHLQYAITWFGLALACLGVGGALLLRPPRRDS